MPWLFFVYRKRTNKWVVDDANPYKHPPGLSCRAGASYALQFYSPTASGICFASDIALQWYCASHRFKANEITLKPQVLISLLTYQKYHSVRSTEYHFAFAPAEKTHTNKRKEQAPSLQVYLL